MPEETAEWDDARRRALCERIRAYHRERDIPFDYPPATEAQLRATEEQLGFPLPPMLRLLYGEVANGGNILSPHRRYPFFGVEGGRHLRLVKGDGRTLGRLMSRNQWRLHPCVADALERYPGYSVRADASPDGFVTLSDQGCGTTLEFDIRTGKAYLIGYAGKR